MEFVVEEEALSVIADKAISKKTGARGLRSILENTMRDIMYEIPSRKDVVKCVVTKDTVMSGKKPQVHIGKKSIDKTKKDEEEIA